jgi:hypothetical protein
MRIFIKMSTYSVLFFKKQAAFHQEDSLINNKLKLYNILIQNLLIPQ